MKKSEQLAMNQQVIKVAHELGKDIKQFCPKESDANWKRLRSCSAHVARIGRFYVLQSYNTTVAFIDPETDTCYDILRMVYGYTATSAQHIAKFDHDYGAGTYGCAHRLTYKEV